MHKILKVFGTLVSLLLLAAPLSGTNIYCLLNADHTLCKYSGAHGKCGTNFERKVPSTKTIEFILEWHNKIRQKVALGKETRTAGTLPQAADMMKLRWDDELAIIAQGHADECVFQHDCKTCRSVQGSRFKVGQNIGLGIYGGSSAPKEINWKRLMTSWDEEAPLFKESYVKKYVFGKWGHYSQIIWWNTRSVGCGGSIHGKGRNSFHLVVCNYGRSGNIRGADVYQIGPPCSQCPEGTQCDPTFNGLCAPTSSRFIVKNPFLTDDLFLYSEKTFSEKDAS